VKTLFEVVGSPARSPYPTVPHVTRGCRSPVQLSRAARSPPQGSTGVCSFSSTIMIPRPESLLGQNILVLSKRRVQERLSLMVSYARSQSRESWWYSPWNEILSYLCLTTSLGISGTGVPPGSMRPGQTFFVCPQLELLHGVALLPSTGLPSSLYLDPVQLRDPAIPQEITEMTSSPQGGSGVRLPLLMNPDHSPSL